MFVIDVTNPLHTKLRALLDNLAGSFKAEAAIIERVICTSKILFDQQELKDTHLVFMIYVEKSIKMHTRL